MAYIGSTPTSQSFTSGTDYFNGNGSTTTFTLSRAVSSINDVMVVIENVVQKPSDAYTIVGTTLTFTSAPPSGTSNIYVRYMSTSTVAIQPNDLSVTTGKIVDGTITAVKLDSTVLQPANISDKANTSTGALVIPVGTTAQRPVSPTIGMVRMNTTTGEPEWYDNSISIWIPFAEHKNYLVEFLLVAGGGSGSGDLGGGGGAGGYIDNTSLVIGSSSYSIVIGAGAAGKSGQDQLANSGNSSTAFGFTAIGGGGGGGEGNQNGRSGGSGGGAGYSGSIGSGTVGQGNNGGLGGGVAGPYATGGGGGAGAAGSNAASSSVAGNGGNGLNWKSLGTYYAGGGGGCTYANSGTRGTGGLGGGGDGASLYSQTVGAGGVNTGGGSGGQGAYDGGTGATGGSGIAIIRYLGPQRGTGGTITSSGGYTYHTFTSSGTFTA